MQEFRVRWDLMLLFEEGALDDDLPSTLDIHLGSPTSPPLAENPGEIKKPFKPKSRNFPDLMTCPAIWDFLYQSIKEIK